MRHPHLLPQTPLPLPTDAYTAKHQVMAGRLQKQAQSQGAPVRWEGERVSGSGKPDSGLSPSGVTHPRTQLLLSFF